MEVDMIFDGLLYLSLVVTCLYKSDICQETLSSVPMDDITTLQEMQVARHSKMQNTLY